jgi:hypothetical protein
MEVPERCILNTDPGDSPTGQPTATPSATPDDGGSDEATPTPDDSSDVVIQNTPTPSTTPVHKTPTPVVTPSVTATATPTVTPTADPTVIATPVPVCVDTDGGSKPNKKGQVKFKKKKYNDKCLDKKRLQEWTCTKKLKAKKKIIKCKFGCKKGRCLAKKK